MHVLYYTRRVLARLRPPGNGKLIDAERLADRMAEFSLAALRHVAVSVRSPT
jgi:hypothetical protein